MGAVIKKKLSMFLFLLFSFFFLGVQCLNLSSFSQGSCAEGWIDGSVVDLGCILFNYTGGTHTWTEAQQDCYTNHDGSHLVEPIIIEQHLFLKDVAYVLEAILGRGHYWWVGATDEASEGRFYYPNHLKPVSDNFPAWYGSNPDSGITWNY